MSLKLITPASTYPVTVAEAKAHLRVDGSDDDTLIAALISAATEMAEQTTGRAIMAQTWELVHDTFSDSFELTRTPVQSITSVKYYDADGVQQTLSNTLYALDNANEFGVAYVVPVYGGSWPDTRDQINAVAVRYVAGYENADQVPDSIKAWIKLQVGAMFENREAEGHMQTHSLGFADRLLDRYKVY